MERRMMSERNLNIEKERYIFRKAKAEDLPAIAEIYSKIHEEEKKGSLYVGWLPGV
jgi:ribosomal protein S18 acetylase RimI-like enzyme